MTTRIKIKAQDLFNALEEKYKFITCDKDSFEYVKAWEFKPTLEKDGWKGSEHTKEELNYMWEENDFATEIPFCLSGCYATQNLWEVEEFINKTMEECILERGFKNV